MKKLLLTLFTILALNSYSQLTYVPDDAFEAYLESIPGVNCDNGIANDNYVLTAGMLDVMIFNQLPTNIADFTGIEACENLYEFTLMNNNVVTELDLSMVGIGLVSLHGFNLDVLDCYNLESLIMPDTTVDLYVNNNYNLTTIAFSPNTSVTQLYILNCYSLESLDLSATPVIVSLLGTNHLNILSNQNLKCLNLKNGFCSVWTHVNIGWNPLLYCVQVDDPNYSQVSWDPLFPLPTHSYSTNCNTNCIVGINEANTPSLSIYPNPSNTGLIQLNTSIVNSDINVYSIEGKQINFTQSNNVIDISDNEKGVYLISIDGVVTRYVYQE